MHLPIEIIPLHSDIRIEFYDNRLEIHSPGSIPGGLTVDDIKSGTNERRNPTVVHVLDKMEYMENFGSGIRRIFKLYDDFAKEPLISTTENSFKITLYNKRHILNQEDIKEEEQLIIRFLSGQENATRQEIQNYIQLSKDKTIRLLNVLISEGIIFKEGKSVSTRYYLKK